MRNLRRLLQGAAEDVTPEAVRMRRAPVTIEGTGEDVDVTPVRIYANDDPRSELAPTEEGYPEDWGIDLREPKTAPRMARPAPAPLPDEVPEGLEGALAGLGGVADRAQAAMEADEPKGLRGFMAKSATGAAMGAGAKQEPVVPPEVAAFAAQKAGAEPSIEADPEVAKKAALLRELSGGAGAVHRGMDIYHGASTPGYGGGMASRADRMEKDEAAKVAAAKDFARRKFEGERQAGIDALNQRKTEAEIAALERRGAPGEPKPRDPLADRKTEAEIAKLEAETEKAKRRGGGMDPLTREKRELELRKLRNEVGGEGSAATPKQKAQIQEVQERYQNIKDNLAALKKQIRDEGTHAFTGTHNADMERRLNNIATDMAKLTDPESVAREGEVAGFRKGLFSPGLGTMNSTALELLENFEKEVDGRRENAYRVRGIDPSHASSRARPALADAAPAEKSAAKTPVSRTPSKDGKWVRTKFSDGTEEVKRAGS